MNIQCVKQYDLGTNAVTVKTVPLTLKNGHSGRLFLYSESGGTDPAGMYFTFPDGIFKMAAFDDGGNRLWYRELNKSVLVGTWFCPLVSFDLDGDGVTEIYFVNNTSPDLVFTNITRVLEKVDPDTGETLNRIKFPIPTWEEKIAWCYRFSLLCGYDKGRPVLVTAQGTYGKLALQGHAGADMATIWETLIKPGDGSCASHLSPVLDFNDDGVDEIFWGEHLLSIADGRELMGFDKDTWHGHSDIVVPFINFDTGKKYVFCCRETDIQNGPRLVVYNADGSRAWGKIEAGHVHSGWLAYIEREGIIRRICMNQTIIDVNSEFSHRRDAVPPTYFDAYTGESVDFDLGCAGHAAIPLDIDGDGLSEFFCGSGANAGWLVDCHGNRLAKIEGGQVVNGLLVDGLQGEQIMTNSGGTVRIYADIDARDGKLASLRHNYKGYLKHIQHMMASGYNSNGSNLTSNI